MSTTILDGKSLANKVLSEISSEISSKKLELALATVLVGKDPASVAYVAGKHRDCEKVGIKSIKVELPDTVSKDQLQAELNKLNVDNKCTGYLVQLPLPVVFKTSEVLNAINPKKDVDGLSPENLGLLAIGNPRVIPCTARAILFLLTQYRIEIATKKVLVIGRGLTVGRPLSILLSAKGNDAVVTLAHSATNDLPALIAQNEIVISAVGKPNWLKADWIKSGSTVIDVGITKTDTGLIGDCEPGVSNKTNFFAPVPGGVGPLTRAMLLRNLLDLHNQR